MPAAVDLHIPSDLAQRDQWVVWRLESRQGKPTKVPYCARTGRLASSTDPSTWSSLDAARSVAEGYEGIGFVFTKDAGIVGIDLDKCRDPQTGAVEEWAAEIVREMESFTEVSPSGKGLHVFVYGGLPPGSRRKGHIEMYDSARYFTVTGQHFEGTPETVEERSEALAALHQRVFKVVPITRGQASRPASAPLALSDQDVIDRAKRARNGAKFAVLYSGDASGYPSASEADFALASHLAYWCRRDAAQMDRLFRSSGLMRDKWDRSAGQQGTYGQVTISNAIERTSAVYEPRNGRARLSWPDEPPPDFPSSPEAMEGVETAIAREEAPPAESGPEPREAEEPPRASGPPPDYPSSPEAVGGVEGPDLLYYPLTDSGNAERLFALYGNQVHYCDEMEQWLLWDKRRWAVDRLGTIQEMTLKMARLLYAQCADTPKDDVREAREKWARKSESAAGINSALTRFKTHPGIPVLAADLDSHPWKLNCANGVLDLRPEGGGPARLIPHDRKLLLTKLCDVTYDPAAKCPLFLQFLEKIMGGSCNPDAELTPRTARLIGFLQRAFGYALTGDTSAKVIFYCYGDGGNNGKSTLLELFAAILKEYSTKINIDTLIQKPGGLSAAQMDDLSALRGTRIVLTSEPDEGVKLKAGLIKALSSGQGMIKTKRLFERHIEFEQTHKIFLEANNLVGVPAYDNAFWDRVRAIPFTVTIPADDRDLDLPTKLLAEAPGILAWAVRGCDFYRQEGIRPIAEIQEQNAEWRAASDPLREFLDDRCDLDPSDPDLRTTVEAMTKGYEAWAESFGEKYPLNRLKFNEALRKKGCRQDKDKGVRTWFGVALRDILT